MPSRSCDIGMGNNISVINTIALFLYETSVIKLYILNLLWQYPIVISGPRFVKEMRNVSIAVGREASIDCHVSDADDYKVSFVNAVKISE